MLISLKFWKHLKPKNVVFVILMLQMYIVIGQKKVIVIDPGHGGNDIGAIGINNLKEKDVVLNIAKEIIQLNKTILNNEFDIYLTRYKDTLISLSERTRLAKRLKADVFISLHCNSSKFNAKGIEVYVHNSDKPNTKHSIELGLSLINESTQKIGFIKRGIKFNNLQVLRETAICPAVLVEIGFMTNKDEVDYFLKTKNLTALALAVLLGIANNSNYERVF